ncbi:MAG: ComEC/Rec2 family competence protein [Clostridiales bacterium]|nr:ComEC/Rec2 family competence protein [Clostridiales bacterium]
MKRPFAMVGLVFFLSLIAAMLMGLNLSMTTAAVFAAVFLFLLICRRMPGGRNAVRTGFLAALLSAAAAFSLYGGYELLVYRPVLSLAGGTGLVRMQVVELPVLRGNRILCEVCVLEDTPMEVTGQGTSRLLLSKGTRLRFGYQGETVPDAYDILEAEVRLTKPEGTWSSVLSDKGNGLFLEAELLDYRGETAVRKPERVPLYACFLRLRQRAADTVAKWVPGDPGGVICSLAYGYRENMSAGLKNDFRTAGIYHLLAVSGLHVGLVAQAVMRLLSALRVNRRLSALLAAVSVLFFMALTGFSPSVMRAGLMAILYFLGLALRREADSLNSLGLALLVMTAANPFAAGDMGLLLSVLSTLGLLLFLPALERVVVEPLQRKTAGVRWLARPVSAVCVTLAATLPTLPVMALTMRQISLVSPLTNLAAALPAAAAMALGCLALPLSFVPVFEPILRGTLFAAGVLSRFLTRLAETAGGWEYAAIPVDEPYLLLWLLTVPVLLCTGWGLAKRAGVRLSVCGCAAALAAGLLVNQLLMREVTTITVLGMEVDGAALLLRRGSHAGLIVTGNDAYLPAGASAALRTYNVGRLDFLFFPDAEDKAAGGIGYLLDQVEVNAVFQGEEGLYSDTLRHIPAGQETKTVGDGCLTFWNDGRMVREDGFVRVWLGDTTLLLCLNGGNAAALAESRRGANLLVFAGAPPKHASALTAQAGVLSCREDEVAAITKALPWGSYSIRITGANGDITLYTRGRGDMAFQRLALPKG